MEINQFCIELKSDETIVMALKITQVILKIENLLLLFNC